MCLAYCSGVIGFMLCSTPGPFVNFHKACNPIEQVVEDKGSPRRPLRFYNSAVRVCLHCIHHKPRNQYINSDYTIISPPKTILNMIVCVTNSSCLAQYLL